MYFKACLHYFIWTVFPPQLKARFCVELVGAIKSERLQTLVARDFGAGKPPYSGLAGTLMQIYLFHRVCLFAFLVLVLFVFAISKVLFLLFSLVFNVSPESK